MPMQEQSTNPMECWVINIGLLNTHIKSVVDHCFSCNSEEGPLGERIILAGEKCHGLASVLSWEFVIRKCPSLLPRKLLVLNIL